MPSLIRKLFHKSEAPKDGLTQPQREAIVDLLNYCMYADNLVFLAEDRLIADTVAKFNWDPKVPFDQFDARSVSNARNASESQVYRDQFLASIKDRLDTAAVKAQALELCQELFLADGAQSYEEDDALQNLRTAARIEVVIPAVEAGLQRGTLVCATGLWPYPPNAGKRAFRFPKEVYPSWSEPARRGGRRPWRARDIPPQNKLLYVSHV